MVEIDRGFKYSREHPVLMKMLFGVSHRVFNERLGWIDNHVTAYRLQAMIMAGLAQQLYPGFSVGPLRIWSGLLPPWHSCPGVCYNHMLRRTGDLHVAAHRL